LDYIGKVTLRRTKKSVTKKTELRRRNKNVRMKKILSEIASGVQKTLDLFTNVLRKAQSKKSVIFNFSSIVPHIFIVFANSKLP